MIWASGKWAFLALAALAAILVAFGTSSHANEVAILAPDATKTSLNIRSAFEKALEGKTRLVDNALAQAVLTAQNPPNPYNMSNLEARNLGTGIGCSYFVLIKADTLRRSSLTRKKYFESFAAVYLVDARSGELVNWHLKNFEMETPERAVARLTLSVSGSAEAILSIILGRGKSKTSEPLMSGMINPRASEAEMRPPLPYRRIKPPYTRTANLYGIAATVDILVKIDKAGKIVATKITRWAGFGLDESVEKTVREMNWRPADDSDGPFTMQVLLRYNFRDIDDETG